MAAAPPPIPASVPNITPSDSSLVPRREFVKYIKTPSSFSILTFSASSQIRFYNFPTPVVSAVRRLLDRTRTVTGHKEDVLRNLVEFSVEGKPWTNPKSLPSEKLLLDIIAVLLHQGYEYRSAFDFGREQDDRAILAFSKPMATTPQSPPSSPALHSQHQRSSESSSSAAAHNPSHLVKHPFAISFPSATILRVISPPLASTPAILQSVRGSWPRGVVSEHKIAPDSYEFKLKGYKWYQEDTFAADSLGYILSLLASLDSHGFSLMASLVITNRSRVKDLWIFTGLADAASLESPGASISEFQTEFKSPASRTSGDARHESLSPPPITELRQGRSHGRSGSLGSRQSPGRSSSGRATLLRKPAPRAQLPVSVASSIGEEDGNADALPGAQPRPDGPVRDPLPSSVDSAVDMTGIGARQWQAAPAPAPEVPSPPEETSPTTTPAIFYQTSAPDHNPYFPDQPELSRNDVPEMVEHLAPPSHPSPQIHASPDPQPGLLTPTMAAEKTPPLLSPDVFRDSALSSGSAVSSEIPITWTGPSKDPASPESEQAKTPVLPGGWSSPAGEVPPPGADGDRGQEPAADINFRPRPQNLTPVRQEVQAATSFAVTQPPLGSARKSETGVLGQVPQHDSPSPPLPARVGTEATPSPPSQSKPANATLPPNVNGEGWVFINVTGGPVPAPGSPSSPSKPAGHPPIDNHAHPSGAHSSSGIVPQLGGVLQSHDEPIPTSLTAAALQIVEKDNKSRGTALAVPSANGSGGSANARQLERKSSESRKRGRGVSEGPVRAADKQQQPSSPPPPSSPLRRIFSQSRAKDGAVRKSRSFEAEDTARTTRSRLDSVDSLPRQRVGLRERWRRRGVPEATTKTDRRMSVD